MSRTRALVAALCLMAGSLTAVPLTAVSMSAAAASASAAPTRARPTPGHGAGDPAGSRHDLFQPPASAGTWTVGLGSGSWHVQSTAATTDWTNDVGAPQSGTQISTPGFDTSNWLSVTADSAGAPGTEVEALLQNGVCPDDESAFPTGTINQSPGGPDSIFYSNNLQDCFYGPGVPVQSQIGATSNPLFDVPWWYQTNFTAQGATGRDVKLVVQGVVGQADVWVNGTEVATQATVEGDYTSYTFDITNLVVQGTNSLALELYPNNPLTMLTLDNVDWTQIPPDNNTGIQFPVSLHVSEALGISNTFVDQDNAPNMSTSALTVHTDVTNNTAHPQTATVTATVAGPNGGPPIYVSQTLSVAAGVTQTVVFSPSAFPQLVVEGPSSGGRTRWPIRSVVSRCTPSTHR